ncbi:MAG: hypothetical protein Q4D95_07180, partial [Peptoniphilus sp.]|nr:hypothetical protein [Peptoniphilus sp.]
DKRQVALLTSILQKKGFEILATGGTASVLRRSGLDVTTVRKVSDGTGPHGEPTIADMIRNGEVDLVLNTPNSRGARADGYEIRTATTAASKPIITTMQQFSAFVLSLDEEAKDLEVMSLQDYEKIR